MTDMLSSRTERQEPTSALVDASEVSFQAPAPYSWLRHGEEPAGRLELDMRHAYFEAMRRCYEATGALMAAFHIQHVVHGYVYIRKPSGEEEAAAERLRAHQERGQALLDRQTNYFEAEVRSTVEEIVERLRHHPPVSAPLSDLVRHLEECIEAFADVMGDLHWRLAFSVRFEWPEIYAEITGRPAGEASELMRGLVTETTHMIRRLRSLARRVQADHELGRLVEAGDIEALRSTNASPAVRSFWAAFRRMLRRWGLRTGVGYGSRATPNSPSWNMRPSIPLTMIATYARSDLDRIDRQEAEAKKERSRALSRVRRALRDDPERLARFEHASVLAEAFSRVMEDHNHLLDQSMAALRREAADVVGRRLVRDGRIDHPDDVGHLALTELRALACGEAPADLRTLVAERRGVLEAQARLEAPEKLGPPTQSVREQYAVTGEGLKDGVLHGVPASAGRYTGPARLATSPTDIDHLEEGDVLVTHDTGPDWTPVFSILGAVVLDRGAVNQHAAVIAREFGIPAVVGTMEATTAIADGQMVTVDGSTGTVELA